MRASTTTSERQRPRRPRGSSFVVALLVASLVSLLTASAPVVVLVSGIAIALVLVFVLVLGVVRDETVGGELLVAGDALGVEADDFHLASPVVKLGVVSHVTVLPVHRLGARRASTRDAAADGGGDFASDGTGRVRAGGSARSAAVGRRVGPGVRVGGGWGGRADAASQVEGAGGDAGRGGGGGAARATGGERGGGRRRARGGSRAGVGVGVAVPRAGANIGAGCVVVVGRVLDDDRSASLARGLDRRGRAAASAGRDTARPAGGGSTRRRGGGIRLGVVLVRGIGGGGSASTDALTLAPEREGFVVRLLVRGGRGRIPLGVRVRR